ncbi:laccase 5 [Mycena floridula]|nr:laccase 5 [Mycena floridula]
MVSPLRSVALAGTLLVTQVFAKIGPIADLVISNKIIAPDGFNRSVVVAGGTFPGPLIVANKGQNFNLNVINKLTDHSMLKSTSIHWHGFFQSGTSWADGPAFVSQCPIATGDSFLYSFKTGTQAGTFWYHSHLGESGNNRTQYCDGLRGAMVVYDPKDPHRHLYDVDDESTVLTLADWYHTVSPAAGIIPTPVATLFNGIGAYVDGPLSALAVIAVKKGVRYRIRLVSMSCDPNFIFSIDGHEMTVIEADGINTYPVKVDSIQIYAGQRYSFVVLSGIRAQPHSDNPGFLNGLNSAILRYVGAKNEEPTTPEVASVNPLLETKLSPLENPGAPGKPRLDGADVDLPLYFGIDLDVPKFLINNQSFVPPTVPVLLQILSGANSAHDLLPRGSVFPLPLDKTIQITFIIGDTPGLPHPFHLHGHAFDVIRSAGSDVYNYKNPVRRDVVNTGFANDSVTIRFRTDNAGPWFLHCHIDWHLELGFAIVMAEENLNKKDMTHPPEAWSKLCPKYNTLTQEQLGGIVPPDSA